MMGSRGSRDVWDCCRVERRVRRWVGDEVVGFGSMMGGLMGLRNYYCWDRVNRVFCYVRVVFYYLRVVFYYVIVVSYALKLIVYAVSLPFSPLN